jgi:hypothetical protein
MVVASHDTLPTSSVCALRYCYFFLLNRVRPQIRHPFLFFQSAAMSLIGSECMLIFVQRSPLVAPQRPLFSCGDSSLSVVQGCVLDFTHLS